MKRQTKSGFKGVYFKNTLGRRGKNAAFPIGYYFRLTINGITKTFNQCFKTARKAALERDKRILDKRLKEPLQILKPKDSTNYYSGIDPYDKERSNII